MSLRGGASYAILAEKRPIGRCGSPASSTSATKGRSTCTAGRATDRARGREGRRVLAVRFSGDYYTQALGEKETEILEVHGESEREGYRLSFGRLKVTVRI